MEKRAFLRMAAGVAAVAAVFGGISAGQWLAASLAPAASPPAEALAPAVPSAAVRRAQAPPPLRPGDGAPVLSSADETPPVPAPPSPALITEAPPAPGYIVGVRGGFIAVYIDDGTTVSLKEATGIPVLALPEEEQARLGAGIRVSTPAALARLLEDYGS